MEKVKVLFLDIDGVLNSWQSVIYFHRTTKDTYRHFCPIAFSNFRYILEQVPDLKIVISSTWRKGRMDLIKEHFENAGIDWSRVIGKTPELWIDRGLEIQQWIDECGLEIEAFVILDDDSDMAHLMDHLVKTKGHVGLDLFDVQKVINRFGIKADFEN